MKLADILRNIKKKFSNYSPSVEVLISKENLLHNLNTYKKSYPKRLLAPVLKSNAYGHGLVEVARILEKEDLAFFAIDSLYEAMILRDKGIKSPLLVIGYTSPNNIDNCRLSNISFTITSLDQLRLISELITNEKTIHLKIDRSMKQHALLNLINFFIWMESAPISLMQIVLIKHLLDYKFVHGKKLSMILKTASQILNTSTFLQLQEPVS